MKLILVPTPIGNLEDITLRAIRVLRECDVVACEDTRRTGILLKHFEISKPMVRLDQHTIKNARDILAKYENVAYCTDAGTPGISDPGYELVGIGIKDGWHIEVLPGPTAVIPALVLSGFPTARFAFEGFLPQKMAERKERMKQLEAGRTVILYESPHKLIDTLEDFAKILGEDHPIALARELSKMHEEVFRGTVASALTHFQNPRGEFVIVISPKTAEEANPIDPEAILKDLESKGFWGKSLVKALVEAGLSRNDAYGLAHKSDADG